LCFLSLSGNVDVSKDLFIILEMGFATTDLDNFKILEDITSFPEINMLWPYSWTYQKHLTVYPMTCLY
jgi:hypothetical protein